MAAPLEDLLMTVKVVAFKKVSFSDTQNPKTLTVYEKHHLLTRDNLTQTIQIQLSEKQKTFCAFFFAFLKSIINFKYFRKKDETHS